VDAALYEAVLALMESLLPEWEVAGYQRERTGSVLPNVAPSNVYPTLDGPVLIAANQAGLTYRAADMLTDPHFAARNAIIRMMHPEFGEIPMQNVVPQLSGTPGTVRSLGPTLGQHNEEIYAGLLKLTVARMAELAAAGVI
jgi:crotonobetainyl-CoA:carnitine CoA-transferase CaiB-like acyl-CoA transferase